MGTLRERRPRAILSRRQDKERRPVSDETSRKISCQTDQRGQHSRCSASGQPPPGRKEPPLLTDPSDSPAAVSLVEYRRIEAVRAAHPDYQVAYRCLDCGDLCSSYEAHPCRCCAVNGTIVAGARVRTFAHHRRGHEAIGRVDDLLTAGMAP